MVYNKSFPFWKDKFLFIGKAYRLHRQIPIYRSIPIFREKIPSRHKPPSLFIEILRKEET